ncbi:Hsp33 protein [Alkaliphilus metalliredigens QYMF]|uniref:33 kDa chaperonin n=1 Tax=Alkaliphilus metalliredigens (strain QYMF) TaxID=293826 RepID=HSLO_ALKMQ|nr:Hsp33 family molecular chaperone HslO [Alkaliphilus metalliredigens]A6TNN7.1 RecName: Full=33 kDa chaperonin; AltName: Full=Heat shock protein 33 homolog; Short=HSP33 [Alkaliphilus metalliredigens QYMF]ABR47805.1 Hsp33 protein [Alkaliphilus metalliredigens QYMF]
MSSRIIRATAANSSIRAFVANTTNLVEKARGFHQTSPVASAALGRTLTATSMMGVMLKGEKQKITTKINGGGPLGVILVVGDSEGNVKGYVGNPQVESTNIRPGKLDVGAAVGSDGEITVIKDLGMKKPYVGTAPLVSGEIGEDFATYFLNSEQQPSAVSLGVLIDIDYRIKASGGFIIQVLPNVQEAVLAKLESRIGQLESITVMMEQGMNEVDILNHVLEGMDPKIVETYEVDFECDCNVARFEKGLISIGRQEIREMIEEDENTELVCHFCNKKYHFNKEQLQGLLDEM